MNPLFDDIRHPAGINHGTKGVGPYFISSVEINFSTSTEDDAVGYVPAGEELVFHPGDGIMVEPDDSTIEVAEVCFGDEDEEHYYLWKAGKFEEAPDPMPITTEQVVKILNSAIKYAQDNLDEIEILE